MEQRGVHNTFSGQATYVIQAGEIHGDVRIGELATVTPADRAAAALARLVQAQCRDEAAAHGLSRRAQLAVRWTTETAVADHSENIGAHLPLPRAEERGALATLAASYRALPVRRLVLLGGAGAGKTSLALLLTLELLRTLTDAEPVPVLLRLSSWNPETEHVDAWLAREVLRTYGAGVRDLPRKRVRELVRDGRLLLVADGLDELRRPLRPKALTALNRALGDDAPLILTSRTAEYVEAVERSTVLNAATVIRAQPVPGATAAEYLRTTAAPGQAHRWAELLDELTHHPDGVPARALSSPLMLWLTRTVYAAPETRPAELLDAARFPQPLLIERHLLDALVPAAFPDGPPAPNVPRPVRGWGPQRAAHWLGFLAAHLTRNRTAEFAWWQLHRARLPQVIGIPLALCAGVLVLYSAHLLSTLLATGATRATDVATGTVAGAVCCLVGGAVTLFVRGLRGDVPRPVAPPRRRDAGRRAQPADARGLLRIVRRGALRAIVVAGLVAGATSGIFAPSASARTGAVVTGAYLGVASVLLLGLWSRWLLAKALLAATGRLPWSLLTFLDDARQVGVVRQVGGVYEFRHARLQARLAARWRQAHGAAVTPTPGTPTALDDGEARFEGRTSADRLRGRVKLYGLFWALALARLLQLSQRDDGPTAGSWVLIAILVLLPVCVDLAAPTVTRRRAELRLNAEAIEVHEKNRTVRHRWQDVAQIAVRLYDEENRGADLPMLHVRLTPGTTPPPESADEESGWLPLWPLGHGDEPTVAPELDAALRRFAGARWVPWDLEE